MPDWFQPRHVRLVNRLLAPSTRPMLGRLFRANRKPNIFEAVAEFEKEERQRQSIAHDLVTAGPEALVELLSRVGVSDRDDRTIGKALHEFGERGWQAVAELADQSDLPKRRALVKTLWELEDAGAGAVPWLRQTLADTDAEVRGRAAHALGRIGPAATSTAGDLIRLAGEDVPGVRTSALWALTRIDADPALTRKVFVDALSADDLEVVGRGVAGLAEINADPQSQRAALVSAFHRGADPGGDMEKLLRRCSGFTAEELRTLFNTAFAPHARGANRRILAELLWQQTHSMEWVFPLLDLMLADDDFKSACDALCTLGPAAAPYAPRLLELVEAEPNDWDLAWAAVDGLGYIGPPIHALLPRIERLTSHPSDLVKARTAKAIRRINGEVVEEDQ